VAIAYLNGQWMPPSEAKVSVFDRGFMFGDGVYEVMPVYDGRIFTKAQHLARLARSQAEIGLAPVMSAEAWSTLLDDAVEKSGEAQALIYVQVTRGTAIERSHVYPDAPPTVLLTVTAFQPKTASEIQPLRVVTAEDIRWHRADIKVTSLIANGMIKNQALVNGYDDAIMIRGDKVTEGTASNVFIVVNGEIVTPPKSRWLLHGITRDEMIRVSAETGLSLREEDFDEGQLCSASEVWLSSTGLELAPVGEVNDQRIGDGLPGPIWRRVFEGFQARKRIID
jgi:D-alanine transaminase